MKEEGFNPNAVITDQVIDALANIQDHEPGSFREHTEKLTAVSYTHLRAHETLMNLVCRLLLEK